MPIETVFGYLAAATSLFVTFIGLPAQIVQNHRHKRSLGIHPFIIGAGVFGYTVWSLYGWMKPDYFVAVSHSPGAIFMVVIFVQETKHRKLAKGGANG